MQPNFFLCWWTHSFLFLINMELSGHTSKSAMHHSYLLQDKTRLFTKDFNFKDLWQHKRPRSNLMAYIRISQSRDSSTVNVSSITYDAWKHMVERMQFPVVNCYVQQLWECLTAGVSYMSVITVYKQVNSRANIVWLAIGFYSFRQQHLFPVRLRIAMDLGGKLIMKFVLISTILLCYRFKF
jgi:hypothetical protein